MKKFSAVLTGFLFCYFLLSAGRIETDNFKETFIKAKTHLSYSDVERAFPLFKNLYRADSSNANISYLLGVCYTEQKVHPQRAVDLLEQSAEHIAFSYDPGSHLERQAPIFVYYYLVEAYRQVGDCKKASEAKAKFHRLYGFHKNDFYVKDALRRLKFCLEENQPEQKAPAAAKTSIEQDLVTKSVEYTTTVPLYGVQVGAYSRLIPIYNFEGLKNVEAFLDKEGVVRYVIGNFIFKKQAETLLEVVKSAGYEDAYIVDVNKEKLYSEEVIIVNKKSLKMPIRGKIDFQVQVGAFKEEVPADLMSLYLRIGDIREHVEDDLTIITTGSFSNYAAAEEYKSDLLKQSIPDAFIVAFNQGRKIPLKRALAHSGQEMGK